MGLSIIGTGRYLPPDRATNEDLTRVMDTTAEWIEQRTGIQARHFAADGVGASDLGAEAAKVAIRKARIAPEQIDYLLVATMTPDHHFPGPAAMVGAKVGLPGVPSLDVRQQCAAWIYQLQLAHALVHTGQASTLLLVGCEAHAGFMPWEDWEYLYGRGGSPPSAEAWERASRHRGLAILFGDGAGAVVIKRTDDERGLLAVDLHSDGRHVDLLLVPGGFTHRPYWTKEMLDEEKHIPRMLGKELFRHAVGKLPESVRTVCSKAGVSIEDVDLFVAHQANDRINGAVRTALRVPAEKVPSNIAQIGNTSAGTIPILLDELTDSGRLRPGMLVCFLALGAGLHWGSALFRT